MALLRAYNVSGQSGFTEELRRFLLANVPRLCYPSLNPDPEEEYRCLEREIFTHFERFICDDERPEQVIEGLKKEEVPSSFCGHIFKGGEPTYSCRTCAMDPTCVLCSTCFNMSTHKEHDYVVSSSNGGGYCDCGDPEAWTQDPWCSHHGQLRESGCNEDRESCTLPDAMKARCELLVTQVFQLAVGFMVASADHLMTKWLKGVDAAKHVVVLHNNEVNTYDEVIRTLERCLKVNRQAAVDFATIVDRIGKSNVLIVDKASEAKSMAKRISNFIQESSNTNMALRCEGILCEAMAFSNFGVYCIRWLRSFSSSLSALRHAVCSAIFKEDFKIAEIVGRDEDYLKSASSWLDFLILSDSLLWKFARNEIHDFYLSVIFKESKWKKQFAIMYTRRYKTVSMSFAHNDYFLEESITMTGVQLFTVISLAHYLLERENVLVCMLKPMIQLLTDLKQYEGRGPSHDCRLFPPSPVRLNEASRERFPPWKRLAQNLHDVMYIVRCPPPDPWNAAQRDNFCDGIDHLMRLLSFIQDMDGSRRQVDYHVENEIEWEYGVKLYIQIYNIITLMVRWAASDSQLFDRVCHIVATVSHSWVFGPDLQSFQQASCDFDLSCSRFNVSTDMVSLHQPFVRFFAALVIKHACDPDNLCNPISKMPADTPKWVLMERPLRCLVWSSQVFANMWRRNGYAMVSMNFFYRSNRFARERLDRDLQLLQFSTGLMEPDIFLAHMMRGFNILDWWRKKQKPPGCDNVKTFDRLLEEFLLILIYIVSERCQVGVGKDVTTEDVYRHELIHLLSRGPSSHSDLIKDMPDHECMKTENIFEKLITEVSYTRKKQGTATQVVHFFLKKEYYKDYNPFYFHFYNTDRTQALEAHRRRLKEADVEEFVVLRPPPPRPVTSSFAGVSRLLPSRSFVVMAHHIVSDAVCAGSRGHMTDNMIERVLYLIGTGLLEDEANCAGEASFAFLKALRGDTFPDKDLLTCLQSLSDGMDRVDLKKLLQWILRKVRELEERMLEAQRMEVEEERSSEMETDGSVADASLASSGEASGPEPRAPEARRGKSEKGSERQKAEAMRRRQKLMAKMCAMQKSFVKENEALLKEAIVGDEPKAGRGSVGSAASAASGAGGKTAMDLDGVPEELAAHSSEASGELSRQTAVRKLHRKVAVGSQRVLGPFFNADREQFRCILCQEDSVATTGKRCIVVTGLTIRSTVLRRDHNNIQQAPLDRKDQSAAPKDALLLGQHLFASAWLPHGVYFSSCGHHMHSDCWTKCFEAHQRKQQRRTRIMNSPQRDFPCPLCNKPCNTVLPVAPELNLLQARAARRRLLEDSLALELRFPAWLSAMLAAQRAAHLLVAGENQEQQLRVLTPSLASLRLPESAEALRALYTSHYARPLLASDRPERDFAQMQEKFACDNFDQWQARLLDQPQPDRSDERLVANLRRTAAYTLIAMDQYLRFCDEEKPTPLFGGMPSMRQWESTQALVRLACIAQGQLTDENDSKRLRGTAFHLLRPLLPLLPPTESELEVEDKDYQHVEQALYRNAAPNLLEVDVFDLFVSLALTSPLQFLGSSDFRLETVPAGSAVEHCLLRLCYAAHLFQAVLCPRPPAQGAEAAPAAPSEAPPPQRCPCNPRSLAEEWSGRPRAGLAQVIAVLRRRAGLEQAPGLEDDAAWTQQLQRSVLPFLRCAALFCNCLTGVEPPPELTSEAWNSEGQFSALCSYLDLSPDFRVHLQGDDADLAEPDSPLLLAIDWWCQDSRLQVLLTPAHPTVFYPMPLNRLVQLPRQYTDVLTMAVRFRCPTYCSTSDECRPAAMCLVCGTIICWGLYCCQTEMEGRVVGGLSSHLSVCGSGNERTGCPSSHPILRRSARMTTIADYLGTGIMLRMRESQVLFLAYGGTRAVPYISPYVDRYGENDIGLSRGNPLHLDPELYAKLNRVWLLHGIHDEIEAGIRLRGGAPQWFDFS